MRPYLRVRLHDSNVDWGQDLGRLADHLRQRYPGEKVWLVGYGSGRKIGRKRSSLTPRDFRSGGMLSIALTTAARDEAPASSGCSTRA